MSPSEDQLRAALRQGEGAAPNVDAIVRSAARVVRDRRERRVRVMSAVGAAVVVAGIAVGITAHSNHNNTDAAGGAKAPALRQNLHSSAAGGGNAVYGANSNDGVAGTAAGDSSGAGLVPSAYNGPQATGISTPCPATPINYNLPGVPAVKGPLFPKPVGSLIFCLYVAPETYQGSRVLTGTKAQQFADLVTSSDLASGAVACPTRLYSEIIPFDSDGAAMGVLSVERDCNGITITNGSDTRFLAPADLDAATGAAASISAPASGAMSGSPAR